MTRGTASRKKPNGSLCRSRSIETWPPDYNAIKPSQQRPPPLQEPPLRQMRASRFVNETFEWQRFRNSIGRIDKRVFDLIVMRALRGGSHFRYSKIGGHQWLTKKRS